ncbi:alpha/beta hydrolase [Psychromarinibacter sp. C21-152]|uniref:Alpha/beta hydrolase n=1 Tax=Psychromarinibacter sediminicola TaxID=3033385 RepID=A0AAE3T7C6_9RHOB|nr:alpha/beta hydrolase [Psychromarinibacter sediminicola]MDF0599513.1 alpha/beta hydrolase [Psychromarinibacter sediminicola]
MTASVLVLSALVLAGCGAAVDRAADRNEAAAERAYPPQGRFVEVDGRRVHVVVEGRGPDLVLIHGASGNARDFTFRFVDAVKDRYRVLAFDRPGLGYTDRVSDRYGGATNTRGESPAEQARLLAAAAAKLGASRPIVLGQSYGGAVALAWALERPTAGLVIVSGATQPWPGQLAPQYPILSSALGGATVAPLVTAIAPKDRATLSLAAVFAPQAPPEGYEEYIGVGLAMRRETLRANARQVSALKDHLRRMSQRYGEITVPVEIVHGTADRIVGFDIHARPLAEQLPNARLTPLRGIGHMPHHVAQEAVIAVLDRLARRAGLR